MRKRRSLGASITVWRHPDAHGLRARPSRHRSPPPRQMPGNDWGGQGWRQASCSPGLREQPRLDCREAMWAEVGNDYAWYILDLIYSRMDVGRSSTSKLVDCISVSYITILLWQKEASDRSEIPCKRAKCVSYFHWRLSVEYHHVLRNISLSRMSVRA